MSRWILLLLYLLPVVGQAQRITVINASDGTYVSDVSIFSEDRKRFAQTDLNGQFDLSVFVAGDLLEFQHPSFQSYVVDFESLQSTKKVYLQEDLIQIEEVVITGTKWEQSAEVPQSVVKISPSEVHFYNAQTSADMLMSSGQVFVQKSQLGGGSPMIRGFSANSLLIAVNGIRMNHAIFRSGNLQNVINIDPNVLEQADVVLGPGSVIYGSDALGGVMNFRVKEPQFATSSPLIQATAFLRFASANKEQTGHVHFNLANKKWSWLSSFSYSGFSDLVTGEKRTASHPDYGRRYFYVIPNGVNDAVAVNANTNKQTFSGYNGFQTIQRLKFRASEYSSLSYDFFYSTTSDIPRYDRLIETSESGFSHAVWKYGPQSWMHHSVNWTNFNRNSFYEELRIVGAFQQFDESRIDRKFQDSTLRNRDERVNAFTLNADFEKEIGDDQQIVYGFEGVYNTVASAAFSRNVETGQTGSASTRYPDGGSDTGSAALYASYQRKLKERMLLTVGARYQHFLLHSKFVDTSFFAFPYDEISLNKGAVTGNIGLTWSTINNWKFDVLLNSGFRAPNVDDIGKVFDSEPGNVIVPNENLGPEYVYNSEVTITKTVPAKLEVSVTGFYSILRDAMVRRNYTFNGQDSILYDGELSRVQALVNTGSAYIAGISGSLRYAFLQHFDLFSTITWMRGMDTGENIPLRHATPAYGKTGLTFRRNQIRMEVYSVYQAKRAFDDLAPSEQNKTHLYTSDGALGWTTLNVNISYQPTEMFIVNGALENITDIHYRSYSSGISAPGRNFVVSLKVSI